MLTKDTLKLIKIIETSVRKVRGFPQNGTIRLVQINLGWSMLYNELSSSPSIHAAAQTETLSRLTL